MKEEVLKKLIEKTANALGVSPDSLNENSVVNDLGLKSLELVGIISEFEEEYDCFIKYTELMHAKTIGETAEIITKIVE